MKQTIAILLLVICVGRAYGYTPLPTTGVTGNTFAGNVDNRFNGTSTISPNFDSPVSKANGGTGTSFGASGVWTQKTNSATGTTTNKLVTFDSSGNAVNVTAGSTNGAFALCDAGCSTSGTATLLTGPMDHSCVFDATAVVRNDYVGISTTTTGDCTDLGASTPTGTEIIGKVDSAGGAGNNTYTIFFYGPDFPGTGGGGVNSPAQAGNPAVYTGSSAVVSGIPKVIHAGTGTLQAAFNLCPTNGPCQVIGDPGNTYTVSSPLWVGGGLVGAANLPQTLILDNAGISCTDTYLSNGTAGGGVDDCLVLTSLGRLYCMNSGSATYQSGGVITAAAGAQLNSVVTTAGGVILDSWQATHGYKVGQVIFDATSNSIQKVTAAGTSSGSVPTFSATINATTSDTGVTWTNIHGTGRFTDGGQGVSIDNCNIQGTTNNTAAVNNVLHISGVSGGDSQVRTVGTTSINGFGLGSHGEGTTGLLIDDGQDNGFCTASHSPAQCCTGSKTGTCQSGQANTALVKVTGLFVSPGAQSNNGPAAGVEIYTSSSGVTSLIDIDGMQDADISGTANVAELWIHSAGGTLQTVNIRNGYEEVLSTQGSTSDGVLIDQARDVNIDNNFMQESGSASIANCYHIANHFATEVRINGRVPNGANPCSAGNLIKNDISGYTLSGAATKSFDYTWMSPSNAFNKVIDGTSLQSLLGFMVTPATLSTFGTCSSTIEGTTATQTNSTGACSAGATATTGGTTHCQVYCNGTNWKQTGL